MPALRAVLPCCPVECETRKLPAFHPLIMALLARRAAGHSVAALAAELDVDAGELSRGLRAHVVAVAPGPRAHAFLLHECCPDGCTTGRLNGLVHPRIPEMLARLQAGQRRDQLAKECQLTWPGLRALLSSHGLTVATAPVRDKRPRLPCCPAGCGRTQNWHSLIPELGARVTDGSSLTALAAELGIDSATLGPVLRAHGFRGLRAGWRRGALLRDCPPECAVRQPLWHDELPWLTQERASGVSLAALADKLRAQGHDASPGAVRTALQRHQAVVAVPPALPCPVCGNSMAQRTVRDRAQRTCSSLCGHHELSRRAGKWRAQRLNEVEALVPR